MSVSFYLKDKSRKKSSILTIVAFKGKYYKRSTGDSVPVEKWNAPSQRCSISGFLSGSAINKRLNALFIAANQACDNFVDRERIPDNKEFWAEVDLIRSGGKIKTDVLFSDYFAGYIDYVKKSREINTYKKYQTAFNKLCDYEDEKKIRLKFQDVDLQFYQDFKLWFYSKNFSTNYFGTVIKNIKVVFRQARDIDKLHNLDLVENKKFKVDHETADSIYLTEVELLRIHRLKITQDLIVEKLNDVDRRPQNMSNKIKSLEVVRAKFLIGAFTALRVSDFNRLEHVNLKEEYIKIRTKKTGVIVTIPIHWVIREIIERGFDITTKISDQKINKHIKEIARLADITEPVEITKNIGGVLVTEVVEKCELVKTHTARRSGATNMVKFGIPAINVMKITGHAKWSTFMGYIKISEEENAELMKQTGFFDKKHLPKL